MGKIIYAQASFVGSSDKIIESIEVSETIVNAYWADINGRKTTRPLYNQDSVKIVFEIKNGGYNKNLDLKIYAKGANKVLVYKNTYTTAKEPKQYVIIKLTGSLFKKGEKSLADEKKELIQYLFFELTLLNQTYTIENKPKEHLHFHYIRFIPKILEAKGWTNAKKVQDIWFGGFPRSSTPWFSDPQVNLLDFDWIYKFNRMKTKLDSFREIFFTTNSKKLLIDRITSMIENGDLIIPDGRNFIRFGIDSDEIIEHEVEQAKTGNKEIEKMPHFEKYYFQSESYAISPLETLDDCFGTLAACQFRAIAMGIIEIKKKDYIPFDHLNRSITLDIYIDQVKVYIKDSFDFIGNDEKLGVWNAETNDISRIFGTGYSIINKFYNDWKIDYNSGRDFHLYSTLKAYNVNKIYRDCVVSISKKAYRY